jgi:hypothetical protein
MTTIAKPKRPSEIILANPTPILSGFIMGINDDNLI